MIHPKPNSAAHRFNTPLVQRRPSTLFDKQSTDLIIGNHSWMGLEPLEPRLLLSTTYYVAQTGVDSNPGTQEAPFQTIHQGARVLEPGDTLLIAQGVYAETFNNQIPGGTSWASPVTIAAQDPGNRPIIRPNLGAKRVFTFSNPTSSYIILDGLVIDAYYVHRSAVKITAGSTGTAHHIRIQNSEIKNASATIAIQEPHATGHGILITGSADHNEFINLDIHHNGRATSYDHGIYLTTSNNLIENSSFHHNASYGIQQWSGAPNGNIIRNNRFYQNRHGILISTGSGTQFYNNIVYNNIGYGVEVATSASNAVISNNTFYANRRPIKVQRTAGGGNLITNNIFHQNELPFANEGAAIVGTNLVGVDPIFEDPDSNDFRLKPDSPAIDVATLLPFFNTDIVGTIRTQGNGWDIGAYEWVGVRRDRPFDDRRGLIGGEGALRALGDDKAAVLDDDVSSSDGGGECRFSLLSLGGGVGAMSCVLLCSRFWAAIRNSWIVRIAVRSVS